MCLLAADGLDAHRRSMEQIRYISGAGFALNASPLLSPQSEIHPFSNNSFPSLAACGIMNLSQAVRTCSALFHCLLEKRSHHEPLLTTKNENPVSVLSFRTKCRISEILRWRSE